MTEEVKSETPSTPSLPTEEEKVKLIKAQREFQESAKKYLNEQVSHVVVPSFAQWFDINSIHTIEERSFPDFFGDNKSIYRTRDIYKNMRDFIVNTYRLNPVEYLTVTAVRKNLSGDVSTIIRIHQFLEKWGLINYQIDPRTKSSIVGPQYTGHFQITLDTPTGLKPWVKEKEKEENDNEQEIQKKEDPLPYNLHVRSNIYTVNRERDATSTFVQYFCNICGKDTTQTRYHNLRIKTYTHNASSTINNSSILCSLCYEQGLFPTNFKSTDFVRLQHDQDAKKWSEQETLLLLEGIEMFSDPSNSVLNANASTQWEKISEHVGTKTKEQCLTKFLQLPIEDKYLNTLHKSKKTAQAPVSESLVGRVVEQLIREDAGKELLRKNAENNVAGAQTSQADLLNQIVELTAARVNAKLDRVDVLHKNLLQTEHQLQMERKQVLVERWMMFDKVRKLKEERPDLGGVLDDLAKPVKIAEVNALFSTLAVDDQKEEKKEEVLEDRMPVSVSEPKRYEFWSA